MIPLILATFTWGANPLSSATLHLCDEADACVTVTNTLTTMTAETVEAELAADGFVVWMIYTHGGYTDPDHVTITAPRGFTVEPSDATLAEGESVTFRIFLPAMG